MKLLRLTWLDLIRHKGTTCMALASLALTIGFAGALYRIGKVADARFSGIVRAGDAIVGAKSGRIEMLLGNLNLEGPYPEYFPYLLYQTLHREELGQLNDGGSNGQLFRLIVPFVYCGKYKEYRLLGTTDAFLHQPQPSPQVLMARGDWAWRDSEVVLGSEVARREHLNVGDRVSIAPWIGDGSEGRYPRISMRVSGILRPMDNAWDKGMFTEWVQSYRIFGADMSHSQTIWGPAVLNYMLVYVNPGKLSGLRTLINQLTVAQTVSVQEARNALEDLTGTGRAMGFAALLSIVLLGGLAMASLIISRFDAKTRQWIILRALGFQSWELRMLLFWEGMLLGVGAILLGATLDSALFPFLRSHLGKSLPTPQDVPSHIWQSWPVWSIALLAALLFSVIPLILFNRSSVRERLQSLS